MNVVPRAWEDQDQRVALYDFLQSPRATPRWSAVILKGAILSLFLTPAIPTVEGAPDVRLEDMILFGGAATLIGHFLLGGVHRIAWGLRQGMLCGFSLFIVASILAGSVKGFPAAPGDLNQLVRLAKYVIIYTAAVTYVHVGGVAARKRRSVLDLIIFCSVVLSLVAIQQFFDLFGLNSLYVPFVAPTQFDTLVGGVGGRPVGLAGNPNELGFLFALAALVTIYRLLAGAGRRHWVALAFQVVGLALTLSRSALLGLASGVLMLFLLSGVMRRWLVLTRFWRTIGVVVLVVFLVTVAGVVAAWQTGFFTEIARFSGLLNPTETSSWRIRVAHWQENISLFLDNPILGVGPLRQTDFIQYAADNEYLLLLRTYGLLGTLYLIATFGIPQLSNFRQPLAIGVAAERVTVLVYSVLLACAVYMFPAAVYYSLVLMPVVLVVIGTGDRTVRAYAVSLGVENRGRKRRSGKTGKAMADA